MPGISLDERGGNRVGVNGEFASMAEFLTEYVTDVSSRGVFIRTDAPVPVGTELDLKFTIIGDELEVIEGAGKVVRVIAFGGDEPAGMGVEFVNLSRESEAAVARVIEALNDLP